MADGKDTPCPPKEEQEARQSEGWLLTEFWGKPFWDWLDLLIIPFFIAGSVAVLGLLQACAQQRAEEHRAQQEALQAYLDQMSELILTEDLLDSNPGSDARLLARARTVTVLNRLVASPHERETNREQVVEFLIEAELVHGEDREDPVISLMETNLSGGVDLDNEDLHGANLERANMRSANLAGANMDSAVLREADLENADLSGANLRDADVRDADMEGVNLEAALLRRANLRGAEGITKEQIEDQAMSLQGATMPDGSKHP
jgi:hypothetical protein